MKLSLRLMVVLLLGCFPYEAICANQTVDLIGVPSAGLLTQGKGMPYDEFAVKWMNARPSSRPGSPAERWFLGNGPEITAMRERIVLGFRAYCLANMGEYIYKDSYQLCFERPFTGKGNTLAAMQIESNAAGMAVLNYRKAGLEERARANEASVNPPTTPAELNRSQPLSGTVEGGTFQGPVTIKGPATLVNVTVISNSFGFIAKGPVKMIRSTISAPVCMRFDEAGDLTLDSNRLDCNLGIEFSSDCGVLMGIVAFDNRIRGRFSNCPGVL